MVSNMLAMSTFEKTKSVTEVYLFCPVSLGRIERLIFF